MRENTDQKNSEYGYFLRSERALFYALHTILRMLKYTILKKSFTTPALLRNKILISSGVLAKGAQLRLHLLKTFKWCHGILIYVPFRGCLLTSLLIFPLKSSEITAQKIKFFNKDFFSKRDQIRSLLRIWSNLLKKSLMKTSFFLQWNQVFWRFLGEWKLLSLLNFA